MKYFRLLRGSVLVVASLYLTWLWLYEDTMIALCFAFVFLLAGVVELSFAALYEMREREADDDAAFRRTRNASSGLSGAGWDSARGSRDLDR